MGKHAAVKIPDLETRRRAIVRALRGESEPPATPVVLVPDERLHRLESDVAAVRSHLAELAARLHHMVTEATSAGSAPAQPTYPANPPPPAEWADDGYDHGIPPGYDAGGAGPDEQLLETPPVPPLDPVAPMSDTASRALFGY